MKVTGYMLREALKQHQLRRDTAARAYAGSLKKFPDEDKQTPQEVVSQFLEAETAIVKLEVAQMRYNLAVLVDVPGFGRVPLAHAIKAIGPEARAEKMWKTATGSVPERYASYRTDDERDPDKVQAKPTITPAEATKLAVKMSKRAGAFRAAIATGNAVEVEVTLEDLDPALFE